MLTILLEGMHAIKELSPGVIAPCCLELDRFGRVA